MCHNQREHVLGHRLDDSGSNIQLTAAKQRKKFLVIQWAGRGMGDTNLLTTECIHILTTRMKPN